MFSNFTLILHQQRTYHSTVPYNVVSSSGGGGEHYM